MVDRPTQPKTPVRRGPNVTRVVVAVAALVVSLILAPLAAAPAEAEISANGETTWGVYGMATGTQTDTIESLVFAIEQIGDRVYVGGKFTEARPSSSSPGTAQPFLAAFDATTGALIPGFDPVLDSAVYALEASPDGSRLYVAGEFTSVDGDGESRGLVALDPLTGEIDTTFRAKVTNSTGARGVVKSLTISGGQLYLAGRFNQVGGGPRPLHATEQVARVSLVDGTADTSFATDVDGGAVWGVAASPDGTRIYLAGYQDAVDGNPVGADYAVLDAATGRLVPSLSDIGGNSTNVQRRYGQDVVAVGDYVFWGGSEHILRVIRASDGVVVREHSTDRGGDFQDLEVVGDRVYASCHCYTNHLADFNWWPVRTATVPPSVQVTPIRYVAAYSATTGAYLSSFLLDVSAAKAGVWAIHGDSAGCLWVGGDISRLTTVAGNDRAAGGFARFCPGDGGDNLPPDAPGALVQTRAEDQRIVIRWAAPADNVGVDHYTIARDGVAIGTRAASGATVWFTDTGLTPGTGYTYSVVAVDAAGNASAPATLSAATTGAVPGADVTPPTAPGNPTQTRAEDHRIVIRWSTSTDDTGVVHYAVTRDGVAIGTKPASTATTYWFTDTGLEPGTTHSYAVVAVDAAGNTSAPATLSAATTGTGAPAAPTGLRSTLQTRERIVLSWTALDGVGGYVIERSGDGGASFTEAGTRTGGWFTDTGLTPGTSYTYRVIAVDASGARSGPAQLVVSTLP